MIKEIKTQVVVIGSGPGGYSAAFRCADLGLSTTIIEQYDSLGGVCLNVGCIPSKALLHIAKIINKTKLIKKYGVFFNDFKIDINKIRKWKNEILNKLTNGITYMAKNRNVNIIKGYCKFLSSNSLQIKYNNNIKKIIFDNAIIATGSSSTKLKNVFYEDSRIWNATDALNFEYIPKRMLVIGGGIIGIEIATIYNAFGSIIDIIEFSDQILNSVDEDIISIFIKNTSSNFNIMTNTKVNFIKNKKDGIYVNIENSESKIITNCYDVVLISIGRTPNGHLICADKAGIKIDKHGFIPVDNQMKTNVPKIYAIGDIVNQPMLAHKSMHQGHIAAEVISGKKYFFDPKVIPSVAYTDPEIAWVGITEKEAKRKGIKYESSYFPWSALGSAFVSNCQYGMTKLIFDSKTNRIIGGLIIGPNSGELLGEISLAIEMCCDVGDIALTIHAHPTLYESIGMAAKVYEGTITDLINNKLKHI